MPRARRQIISGACYEICFRAKNSLPLVAYNVINLIIAASIARAQRDNKVILCHDIWNGSHPHIILIAKDAQQCTNFYGEVEKKITDCLKRLLGLNRLNIWDDRTTVAHIKDIAKAQERIAYLYSNPAQDNLVDSIDKFPGYSSWREFNQNLNSLSDYSRDVFPWIRLPSIPLGKAILTHHEDNRLTRLIRHRNKKAKHLLIRQPNVWMQLFGISTDEEVRECNQQILARIRENEADARFKRQLENKPVMGVKALCSQEILKPHTPKKQERKVYILSSIKEVRVAALKAFKEFCQRCHECYELMLRGEVNIDWPEGAFRPPIRPNMNILFEAG